MATTRTALVTGGASGIGAAAAERLRVDGLKVITLDLAGTDVCADVTNEAALRQVIGEVGPVDVLVNSAALWGRASQCWRPRPRNGARFLTSTL